VTTGGRAKIQLLPGDVVSRIAAGEVVERPAAVVKELVENSLDAGARSVTVDIQDGGLRLIRVADDGDGMSREDAPLAFERHATSKLRSDRDLWSIRTMGFRGEALPSIASVSRVRVVTAVESAEVGTHLELNGGKLCTISDAPPVKGTSIEVAELFANQPARKKFLKSIPTEFSHISRVVQQAALAWPAVHFRLTHNGQDVLQYPAAPSDRDRVGQVFPRTFLRHSVAVEGASAAARLTGWTIDPVHAGSSRTPQELFVNRRPVRHTAVFHAIAEGYGSFLPKGHQPLFVLFLDIDADRVDVNVHPTKREVRFSENERVHELVRRAVRQALGGPIGASHSPGVGLAGAGVTGAGAPAGRPMYRTPSLDGVSHARQSSAQPRGPEAPQLAFVSEAAEPYLAPPSHEVVPLGQLNRTFLVAQIGGDLAVIDQHTAHERVLFERLVRQWGERAIQSQPLLIPEPIELPQPAAALLERYRDDLAGLGLELEPFGASAVLLRTVPVGIGKLDPGRLIPDVLEDLSQWERASSLEERVRPLLASVACHGAVRSGRSMDLPEIKALVDDWIAAGSITTCPHGRRTSFRLSTEDLEKMFGRAGW
jgi:DNA mismatch repair protein MutL